MKVNLIFVYTLLIIFCSQSDAQNLSGGPKIQGPWLWVIASTSLNNVQLGGAAAAISGIDFLSRKSDGAVTEQKIAAEGAIISESVGNEVWTLGLLPPKGSDNINDMLISIGLADTDLHSHVAYGSILLNSPQEQDTLMFAGSDDAVKVWLNGEIVHENFVDRGAHDYQDVFRLTLKQGKNVLLVAVYEAYGGWSGFFGFENGAVYEILPPRGLSVDINTDGKINTKDLLQVFLFILSEDAAKKNPRTDVNKDGIVNIADLQHVIDYLDDPVTGAAPALQHTIHHPKGKLATTWARLKMER